MDDIIENPISAAAASTDTQAKTPEEELAETEAELAAAEEKVAKLKAEVKSDKEKLAEFKQATNGYDAFFKMAQDQLKDLKAKIADKTKMAESVITKAEAEDICKQISNEIIVFDNDLELLGKDVDTVRKAWDAAKTNSLSADAELQRKQEDYDAARKLPKTIESQLKEMQNLLSLAESGHDRDDHVQMYLLTQIAQKALADKTDILPPADYEKKLTDTRKAFDQKKSNAESSKSDADQKSADLANKVKRYDAAKASKQADLLKRLKDIKTKEV